MKPLRGNCKKKEKHEFKSQLGYLISVITLSVANVSKSVCCGNSSSPVGILGRQKELPLPVALCHVQGRTGFVETLTLLRTGAGPQEQRTQMEASETDVDKQK